jgi:hypothetical protein
MPFRLPDDLRFNTGKITNPRGYARERGCVSWLFLCGDEFASMEGGMSFDDVQAAVDHAARVICDPPRVLDVALARAHVAALDDLPRPTLVTCRAGPRSSAVVYMYAGLKAGANPDDVIQAAIDAHAPFTSSDEYRAWVKNAIDALRQR